MRVDDSLLGSNSGQGGRGERSAARTFATSLEPLPEVRVEIEHIVAKHPSYTESGSAPYQEPDVKFSSGPFEIPEKFSLGALRDGRFRVVNPIEVVLGSSNGRCTLEALELNEFGYGSNPSEAIADLQDALVSLYDGLEAEQDRLGAELADVWHLLSSKVNRLK